MARLALTTTPDRAAALATHCHEVGIEPVVLPCIEFDPASPGVLDEVRDAARQADWLVVTSSRTVSVLWPHGEMPDVPVATVGSVTARAVRDAGGSPTVVGEGGAVELVDLIGDRLDGADVVFPHGSAADDSTIEALRAAGAVVDAHVVYEIRPLSPAADAVDAAVFGSPTAVRGWLESRTLKGLVTGAIGDTTAHALREHSVEVDIVPSTPTFEGLIDLVAQYLRDRSAV